MTTNYGNWIVGVNLCQNNPYDGHTLAQTIATIKQITRVSVTNAYVDRAIRATMSTATRRSTFGQQFRKADTDSQEAL